MATRQTAFGRTFDWTDERLALAKQRYFDGASAGTIAAELGGVTRNAVIGMSLRKKWARRNGIVAGSGLPGRPTGDALVRRGLQIRPLPQPREPDDDEPAQAIPFKPPRSKPERATVSRLTNRGNRFDVVEVNEPAPVFELPPDHSEFAVSFEDVRADQCRWPLGRDDAPTTYCGSPKSHGSYCARHFSVSRKGHSDAAN